MLATDRMLPLRFIPRCIGNAYPMILLTLETGCLLDCFRLCLFRGNICEYVVSCIQVQTNFTKDPVKWKTVHCWVFQKLNIALFLHTFSNFTIKGEKVLSQLYNKYFKQYPAVYENQSTSLGCLHVSMVYSWTETFLTTGSWGSFSSGLDPSFQQISRKVLLYYIIIQYFP